jgi:hypothetical protein
VAVEMDERDGYLGKNAHNNSLLTDDSGENHHVFDFDESDEEGETGSVRRSVNASTLGSTAVSAVANGGAYADADADADNSGMDLLATAASALEIDCGDRERETGDGYAPEVSEEEVQVRTAECKKAME